MSSLRTQRERNRKTSAKDHKLARLINTQALSDIDKYFINYAYEERQHLNFFYSICSPVLASVVGTHYFFRMNSGSY